MVAFGLYKVLRLVARAPKIFYSYEMTISYPNTHEIYLERNPKQENIMMKLELALEDLNRMGIKDTNKLRYKFKLV